MTAAVETLGLPAGFGYAIDTSTGEAFEMLDGKPVQDQWTKLADRHIGRAAARRLLKRFRVTKGGFDRPAYRVVRCGWNVMSQTKGVEVFRALGAPRAHFAGLVTCGSVWHCMCCAPKVAARRAAEMVVASERARAEGGSVGLITLTVKHQAHDTCAVSLERLKHLQDRVFSGKRAKQWREAWGVQGQIRALEFTIGDNGWHPHIHSLLFVDHKQDAWEAIGQDLRARYQAAAKSEFGWHLPDVAVDVRGGDAAAAYVSGWTIESEVSGGSWKKGKGDSSTPFDLLIKFSRPDGTQTERKEAGRQFVEYATAVARVEGERVNSVHQLVWSRGLRERFAIETKTDEQIAAEAEEPALLLGNLTFSDWLRVINVKAYDARLVVLQLASVATWDEVVSFVRSLPQPETHINVLPE